MLNPPPLSLRISLGGPNLGNPSFKNCFLLLLLILQLWQHYNELHYESVKCNILKPLICFKAIEIKSLKFRDSEKPTFGFNEAFLHFKHTVHFYSISFIKLTSSLSTIPDKFINFKILFELEWPNSLCNFSAILCFCLSVLLQPFSIGNDMLFVLFPYDLPMIVE